jgi:hypothetical protein
MSQFPEITSNLSTANWRASVLTFLKNMPSSGGGGGNVTITGSLPAGSNVIGGVTLPSSSTSSATSFTTVTTSAQVLAANSARKGIVFYNQGAGNAFVLLGSGTASATSLTVGLGASDTVTVTGWTGAVQAYLSAAATLNITELS